jgi:hypothetical protein
MPRVYMQINCIHQRQEKKYKGIVIVSEEKSKNTWWNSRQKEGIHPKWGYDSV